MVALTLEWDRSLVAKFGPRATKGLQRALSRAGSDAIRAIRVESNRYARARKRFKVARVNAALPLTFPRGAKSIEDLVWTMRVRGEVVPVASFPHRQTRQGVRVEINTGKTVLIRSAFLATMRSGHKGVFRRAGKARLPINELFTTRISDVFKDAGMVPSTLARGQAVFAATFARLLPVELAK